MNYHADLVAVARGAVDEIKLGLEQARAARDRAVADLRERERDVAIHEHLLSLVDAQPEVVGSMTLHVAMAEVLKTASDRRLRPADLLNEVNRRGLYRMRDGRAVELQQIHARVGNYPHMFAREGAYIRLV